MKEAASQGAVFGELRPARSGTDSLLNKVFKLLRHPSLAASAVFFMSGGAFALGNLLLARTLSVTEFGQFALALALFNIVILIAPLGLDQFMLRHRFNPDARLIGLVATFALLVGLAVSAFIVSLNALNPMEAVALTISIVSGAVIVTANAALRSRARTLWGLAFTTGASWMLLAIGGAALLWRPETAAGPLIVFALGNMMMALVAVRMALRPGTSGAHVIRIDWRETFSLLGIAAVGTIALQVERLLVPGTLGLADLAIFAVLASTAIFPFRLLVAGVGFSLVPRLRRTTDPRERRRIVGLEILAAGGLALAAAAVIMILTPLLVPWLTIGAYHVSYGLTAVACLNGLSKLAHAMATAILTGCGTKKNVHHMNRLSFAWLALACAGGWAGSSLGLMGLLLGVSIGGLAVSVPTVILAYRSLA
jgi:O-antigen/teichoic acid export membrane protein